MDLMQRDIIQRSESMKVFCGEDESFVWSEWKQWRAACQKQGEQLPPDDFKKKNKSNV